MSSITFPARSRAAAPLEGARAMIPLLVAVAPLGLVVGVRAAEIGAPGWATGILIYGASAQLAAIDLVGDGVHPAVIVVTVVVINLRLALYSLAMAPHWRATTGPWRALAAYLLVDPAYAVGVDGYGQDRPTAERHAFYLGAAAALWVGWQAVIAAGMTIGGRLPAALSLELAVPLCLVAMILRRAEAPGTRWAAVVAAVVAVLGDGLPLATGLLAAILAGVAAGLATDGAGR